MVQRKCDWVWVKYIVAFETEVIMHRNLENVLTWSASTQGWINFRVLGNGLLRLKRFCRF